MIIRLYHFLNTSWEWSLLLRFLNFLINLLLLGEFMACILVFMGILLNNILLRWSCFRWRLCPRWLIIWLNALIITFFRLQFLFSIAWISLSIYLSLRSLLNVNFILIVIIIQNFIRINKFRAASSTCYLLHFLHRSLISNSCLINLIKSFHVEVFDIIWSSYHLRIHAVLIIFSTFISQYVFIHEKIYSIIHSVDWFIMLTVFGFLEVLACAYLVIIQNLLIALFNIFFDILLVY